MINQQHNWMRERALVGVREREITSEPTGTLPMHLPANFFEIRIGAQFSLRAKYDRNVVPSGQSSNEPFSKSVTMSFANFSSSADHLPALWTKYSSCSHGSIPPTGAGAAKGSNIAVVSCAVAVSRRLRLRVIRLFIVVPTQTLERWKERRSLALNGAQYSISPR